LFPNLRGIAKQGKMMKHQAKGLSLLNQKLEENFSLNYSFTQCLRQEIKSNIMKEMARIGMKKRRDGVD